MIILALLGAIGIVITVFIVILVFVDRPVKAFITSLILGYTLFLIFIYIIRRIIKHKAENYIMEKRHE
jgi:hypothetical protein